MCPRTPGQQASILGAIPCTLFLALLCSFVQTETHHVSGCLNFWKRRCKVFFCFATFGTTNGLLLTTLSFARHVLSLLHYCLQHLFMHHTGYTKQLCFAMPWGFIMHASLWSLSDALTIAIGCIQISKVCIVEGVPWPRILCQVSRNVVTMLMFLCVVSFSSLLLLTGNVPLACRICTCELIQAAMTSECVVQFIAVVYIVLGIIAIPQQI